MTRPMKYMPIAHHVSLHALMVCECGAVIFNTVMHDAYHAQNDRDVY